MESFGARLRYERERRQINLRSIAETTKISVPLLEGLERDDVSRWPSGIFRKSFIRSYAEAIGLDPEPIVREFVDRYPDPLEVEGIAPALARHKPEIAEELLPPAGPLSIKLTIRWTGTSPLSRLAKLTDWKAGIGRFADSKLLRFFLY